MSRQNVGRSIVSILNLQKLRPVAPSCTKNPIPGPHAPPGATGSLPASAKCPSPLELQEVAPQTLIPGPRVARSNEVAANCTPAEALPAPLLSTLHSQLFLPTDIPRLSTLYCSTPLLSRRKGAAHSAERHSPESPVAKSRYSEYTGVKDNTLKKESAVTKRTVPIALVAALISAALWTPAALAEPPKETVAESKPKRMPLNIFEGRILGPQDGKPVAGATLNFD